MFGGFVTFLSPFILPLLMLVGYYTQSLFNVIDGVDHPPKWNPKDDVVRGVLPTAYFAIGVGGITLLEYILVDIYAPLIIFGTSITFLFAYIYPAFIISKHRTDTSTLGLILSREYVTGFLYFFLIYIVTIIFSLAVLVPSFIIFNARTTITSLTDFVSPMVFGYITGLGIIPIIAISVVSFITIHIGIAALGDKVHDKIGDHPRMRSAKTK